MGVRRQLHYFGLLWTCCAAFSAGLPWIWISMDISMNIILAHLLNTYMLCVSMIFSCLSFLLCISSLFTLLSQMNNQSHQHAII